MTSQTNSFRCLLCESPLQRQSFEGETYVPVFCRGEHTVDHLESRGLLGPAHWRGESETPVQQITERICARYIVRVRQLPEPRMVALALNDDAVLLLGYDGMESFGVYLPSVLVSKPAFESLIEVAPRATADDSVAPILNAVGQNRTITSLTFGHTASGDENRWALCLNFERGATLDIEASLGGELGAAHGEDIAIFWDDGTKVQRS